MGIQSLLLSSDPEVLTVVQPALDKLGVQLEVHTATDRACQVLSAKKFDAVMIDCGDGMGSLDLLRWVRNETTNKNSVSFAILSSDTNMRSAFDMGASFVLQKPVTPTGVVRSFSAAHGLMVRERHRYVRHVLETRVTICFVSGKKMQAFSSNISERGIAVRLQEAFPNEPISMLKFMLPESRVPMVAKVQVAWADNLGRAGLRFLELAPTSRTHLEQWLQTNSGRRVVRPGN
jgi:CheY-like chemotaxis protein